MSNNPINIADISVGISDAVNNLNTLETRFRAAASGPAAFGVAVAGAMLAVGTAMVQMWNQGSEVLDGLGKTARAMEGTSKAAQSLKFAADLSGASFEKIEAGVVKMNMALHNTNPNSAANQALTKLGLSGKELLAMDVDQRLITIAKSFDTAGLSLSQQGEVLKTLGIKGTDFQKIMENGGKSISDATEQLERFGLTLSNADTSGVEAANDAWDTAKKAISGVSEVFAAEFAPIVQAVSELFIETAEQGEGIGTTTREWTSGFVTGLSYVMDGLDVVVRLLTIAKNGIESAFGAGAYVVQSMAATWVNIIDKTLNWVIEKWNNTIGQLPGMKITPPDLSGITATYKTAADESAKFVKSQADDMEKVLNAEQWGAKARRIRDENRKILNDKPNSGAEDGEDPAVAKQRKVDEDRAKREQEARDKKAADEKAKLLQKASDISNSYKSELEQLRIKKEQERAILNEAYASGAIDEQTKNEAMLAISNDFHTRQSELEKEAERNKKEAEEKKTQWIRDGLAGASSALGDLSTLMSSESRKQFEVGKAAATGKAVIDTYQAAQGAYSSLSSIPYVGPALGIAAAAAATVAGMARVKSIQNQKFGGGTAAGAASATSGGGGGTLPPAYPGAQNGGGTTIKNTNINLAASDRGQAVSTDTMQQFMDQINKAGKDGRVSVGFAQ